MYVIYKLTINVKSYMINIKQRRVKMKNEVIQKVNKMGKAGQVIAKIAKIMLSIAFVTCLVCGVFLCLIPEETITMKMSHQAVVDVDMHDMVVIDFADEDEEGALEINGVEYTITNYEQNEDHVTIHSESESYEFNLSHMWWVMIPALLSIAAIYVVLFFVEKLCKVFRDCETPFSEEVVKLLEKIAIAIIPMCCLSPMTESLSDSIMTGTVNIVLGVDMMMVVLVVLIFMLAAIFKYGTMLQVESDETL